LSHSLSCHVSEKPETSDLPAATTMDLLINMENSAEALRQNTVSPSNAQSTDFLQLYGCFDPSNSSDMASSKADFRYICSHLWFPAYIYIYIYICMKLRNMNLFFTLDTHGLVRSIYILLLKFHIYMSRVV
jgi:hypothetical protein